MTFIQGVTDYTTFRNAGPRDNGKTIVKKAIIARAIESRELTFKEMLDLVNSINVSELTGKLTGFYAVSTSVLMNPICQARAKVDGSICKECYAANNVARYSQLCQALECNYEILNGFLIDEIAWTALTIPTTNGYSRIEAHGDVATVTCARNYIRIINSHSWIKFGVWTKNIDLWIKAFELEGGKPENMTFIVSSPFVNVVMDIPEYAKPFVDHVFTVYDPAYVEEHDITINCGARDCGACLRCYKGNTDYYINELLK